MKNNMTDLRNHLFLTLEKLHAANDPEASETEKIDVETAKQIASISKVIVDAVRVEVTAASIVARAHNPRETSDALRASGLLHEQTNKTISNS